MKTAEELTSHQSLVQGQSIVSLIVIPCDIKAEDLSGTRVKESSKDVYIDEVSL